MALDDMFLPKQQGRTRAAIPVIREKGGKSAATLDFERVQQEVEKQNQLTAQRQMEQVRTSQEQTRIRTQSTQLAKQQVDSSKFLLDSVQKNRAAAAHARQLTDSGNPLDELQLLGLKILNPGSYDRQTRMARLEEDKQHAAVLGSYFGLQQDALQSELNSSTAQLDQLKTLEAIGQEKILQFAANAEMMQNNMAASATMRNLAINGLDPTALQTAIAQSKITPNGLVSIGGIDLDARTLEDRLEVLKKREYDQLVLDTGLKRQKDEAAHLEDELAGKEHDRQVKKDEMADYPMDRAIQKGLKNEQAKMLIEKAQDGIITGMNKEELIEVRENGYKWKDGTQFNPDAVEKAYDRQNAIEADKIQRDMDKHAMDNYDIDTLTQSHKSTAAMMARVPVGSPIHRAAGRLQAATNLAATYAGPTGPDGKPNAPIARRTAIAGYERELAVFQKVVEEQAKLESKNDKDLLDLKLANYRGEPIPQESLTNAVTTRLQKFRALDDVLPREIGLKVQKKYQELMDVEKRMRGPADERLVGDELKSVQAQMAQEALDFGINEALQGATDTLMPQQVTHQGHPLQGRFDPVHFGGKLIEADQAAAKHWAEANQLTAEQAIKIRNNEPVEGKGDPAQLMQDLRFREGQELLQMLDATEPGLSTAYTNWWKDKGMEYVQGFRLKPLGGNSFQTDVVNSVAGDLVSRQFSNYAMTLIQADAGYQEQMVQRQTNLLTFGSNPQNAWAATLSQNQHLQDPERAELFTKVVDPAIREAQAKGLDFDQTNTAVIRAIDNYQPQDPHMKNLMRTWNRDRVADMESIGKTREAMQFLGMTFLAPTLLGRLVGAPERRARMGWYRDIMAGNPNESKENKPWINFGGISIGGDSKPFSGSNYQSRGIPVGGK